MDAQSRLVDAENGYGHFPVGSLAPATTGAEWPIRTDMRGPAWFRSPGRHRVQRSPIERTAGHVLNGQELPAALRGAVIALGNFDGLHAGHQEVASRAVEMARSRGVAAILGTFDPHPSSFFNPNAAPSRLTTLAQRQRLAAATGVDAMLVFGFNAALSAVSPEDFVQHWLAGLGGVVTGQDFRFGRGRAGDIELLQKLGGRQGLACATVAPVIVGADTASSTRIRAALKAGDCTAAARMLTRPYAIEGIVRPARRIDSSRRGAAASIELGGYLRPRNGVYAIRATLPGGRVLRGSAYLPEASGALPQPELALSLDGLDHGDFGLRIAVELIAHLEDAAKTLDVPALQRQMAPDHVLGRSI